MAYRPNRYVGLSVLTVYELVVRIITGVPELQIIDDELWQSAKMRQRAIAETRVNLTAAVRASPWFPKIRL